MDKINPVPLRGGNDYKGQRPEVLSGFFERTGVQLNTAHSIQKAKGGQRLPKYWMSTSASDPLLSLRADE